MRQQDRFREHFRRGNAVSPEVSPLLAYDTRATVAQAKALHAKANKPTSSSRSPAPRKVCRRSRKRSSPASR